LANLLTCVLASRLADDVVIRAGQHAIRSSDLAERASLQGLARLKGRNLLLRSLEPLNCALSMIELDGVAKRMVICPPDLPEAHVLELAAMAEIDAVITDGSGQSISGLESFQIQPCAFPREQVDADISTEWVLLTSGTTGVPKMVSHSFDSLTSNIKPPKIVDKTSCWASFNDARRFSGLQMFLHTMLTGAVLLLRGYDVSVPDFLPILAQAGATHVSGTPTHWRKVLMFPSRALLRLQQITLVGEIADQTILDLLHEAFPGARLTHIYGSTESGTGFSVHDGMAGFPEALMGMNLGGAVFKVENDVLKVKSVRSAEQYVGIDFRLKDAEGFIDTGDVVQLVGDRYMFRGRSSGTINVGGSQVHPEEVESLLNADPHVLMSRVIARKSAFTSAILVAEIVLTPENALEHESLSNLLLKTCREKLPPYKVPAMIKIVDELNVSAAGKLERTRA
jgi:acyl-coenzyme A synthetase/AMP-(fatty) acid ligase